MLERLGMARNAAVAATIFAVLTVSAAPAAAMHLGEDAPPDGGAGGVLIIGDSLMRGTAPYLNQELPGATLEIDAQKGRSSAEGLDVLSARLRPEHRVVVFDLGVNDDPSFPDALAADLRRARSIAGARCVVVATLSAPPYAGIPYDGLNRAVESFAARNPGVQLVDWRQAAAGDPGLLDADGVHALPAGYALRATLVAQAVDSCLAASVPTDPQPSNRQTRIKAGRADPQAESPGVASFIAGLVAFLVQLL